MFARGAPAVSGNCKFNTNSQGNSVLNPPLPSPGPGLGEMALWDTWPRPPEIWVLFPPGCEDGDGWGEESRVLHPDAPHPYLHSRLKSKALAGDSGPLP